MKKTITICLMLLTLFCVPHSAFSQSEPRPVNFMLLANIGFGYSDNSKLNDVVAGYGDVAATALNTINSTNVFKGEEDKAGFSYNIEAEGRLFFSNLGVGVSLGYHSAGEAKSTAKACLRVRTVLFSRSNCDANPCNPIL